MSKTARETHIKKLLVRLHGKEVGARELADGKPFFTYSREWLVMPQSRPTPETTPEPMPTQTAETILPAAA
ncbi:hypothetical protein Ga0100231_016855 [Opitutaceae bacterium TAV4]|nr:hypothetical protein Ga0100231_016855 [Opitutaceae bacterium TAV4]RRK02113.1 hypothetical protein Ga0100230_002620 [Opitutaceae bacterium TAV3]